MSGPFRIERTEGCGQCGHGEMFDVIGPDDVAHSTSYGDEEEARSVQAGFNRAFELGRAQGFSEGLGSPWIEFTEATLPPDGGSLIVWDAQFNSISSSYWLASINTLETAREMRWTHWMDATRMRPPLVRPKQAEDAPAPEASADPPAPQQPAPDASPATLSTDRALEDWDDIPF